MVHNKNPKIKNMKNILSILILSMIVIGCVGGTPEEHFEKGVQAFQKGDTLAAIGEFQKTIKLKPDFAAAYFNLGICYSTPENREKAIENFSQAVKYRTNYTDAIIALSQAYARTEKFARAIETLKKGLAGNPNQSSLYSNMAYCFLNMPAIDSAIVYYKKAYQMDSCSADISYNLAYAMTDPKYSDESIRYLRRAILCDDQKMEAHYLLGSRLAAKKNRTPMETSEAIKSLERYLESGQGGLVQVDLANKKIKELKGK